MVGGGEGGSHPLLDAPLNFIRASEAPILVSLGLPLPSREADNGETRTTGPPLLHCQGGKSVATPSAFSSDQDWPRVIWEVTGESCSV